jgi:SPP1 gp7 family putative phage head morphogenesis protein
MSYLSEIIAEAVWLRRVENGLAKEIELIFNEEIPLNLQSSNRQILDVFSARTQRRIDSFFDRVSTAESNAIISIADKAAKRTVKAMEKSAGRGAAGLVDRQRLESILENDSIEGFTVNDWRRHSRLKFKLRLQQEVNEGLSKGESVKEIKERLQTKVFKPALKAEQSVAKTAANNVSNAAIWESAEMSGLSKGYRLKVTLDGRTSKVCLSFAATPKKIYPYASGSPRPPFHMQCRTIILPTIIGKESQDIPADGDAWFKGLSEKEKIEVLGKERTALFNRGKIGLSDLVRSDLTIATVPELRGVAGVFGL